MVRRLLATGLFALVLAAPAAAQPRVLWPGVTFDTGVQFTPNGPVRGTEALRKGFEQLFAEWGKPGVKFTLKQRIVDGKNAYIFWDAETADNVYEGAMDAFVVEEGKISAHFFSGKITPKAPPQR